MRFADVAVTTTNSSEAAGKFRCSRRRSSWQYEIEPRSFADQLENMVEAAGVEIYRDVNETERLLHEQELGVLGDPTSSVVIWWSRAERGQSVSVEGSTLA